jgi:hypothetical protein
MGLADRMSRTSPLVVLAALALIRIASVGIQSTPNVNEFVLFARDPFSTVPLDGDAFITGSPMGPLLAHVLHMESTFTYSLLHFGVLAAGLAVIVVWLERTCGRAAATGVAVLLVAPPLSTVLLTWLGQPDVFIVVAGGVVAVAAAGSRSHFAMYWLPALAGLVLGFSTSETSLIALVALAFVGAASNHRGRVVLVMAAVGLVLGRLGVAEFHNVSSVPYVSRLREASDIGYYTLVRRGIYNFAALLYSTFGAAWLLVAAWLSWQWRVRHVLPWGAVLAWFIAVGTAFIVLDQTRDATLVLWPASVWVAYTSLREQEGERGVWLLLAATVVVATVIPALFVWNGAIQTTSFAQWFKNF